MIDSPTQCLNSACIGQIGHAAPRSIARQRGGKVPEDEVRTQALFPSPWHCEPDSARRLVRFALFSEWDAACWALTPPPRIVLCGRRLWVIRKPAVATDFTGPGYRFSRPSTERVTVEDHSELIHGGCGRLLGLPGGSSCIHTRIAYVPLCARAQRRSDGCSCECVQPSHLEPKNFAGNDGIHLIDRWIPWNKSSKVGGVTAYRSSSAC